ncbi:MULTISPECIES: RHS repeat-associated core domain-containing protein [unclassified Pseudomonas]|uniref:RHS repeat-associated core domain-containing protein n=1 Tax=unclassified Pseudomonas TaxID=196821 RepID=UPI0021C842E7|nr:MULTISPECIES: RHS repeat-associated core domain-containing protein [unclassified Pseudomonas]MCU1734556.1 RHS repeat-associated core domain-containing protein [Pseudomonas sp. 20P_3.2_Bac4]MCU1742504.1 RHS repeat-associated core domain-containing protein [Pseudomonas sp. 20P_3.2_Bac5]
MSQTTASTSVTETTLVTCDPALGLPTKVVAGDGQTTHFCYYPVAATASKPDHSDKAPQVSGLITGLQLENSDATPLSTAMALTCPVIHDTTQPPLMAQYQFLAFPDGSVSDATLTVYGYAKASLNQEGVLIPDTILSLEGVTVDTTTVPWTVTKATGRAGLSVGLQQVERKKDDDVRTTVSTATAWYKDNAARQTRKLVETLTADHDEGTLRAKSATTLKVENLELSPVLSHHIRSARSGRTVRETQQDDLGRPERMLFHTYDARDRLLGSTTCPYDEESFLDGSMPEEGQTVETITWTDTHSGTWVSTTGPDGRCGRVLLDGLQRPVRWELQRTAGADHADSNYVCLQEMTYGADGEVAQQCVYDYFPGGLCLRSDGIALPDNLRDWFWTSEKTTGKTDAEQGDSLTTERLTGTVLKGPQHALETKQRNHRDGQVTLTQTQKSWEAGTDKLKGTGVVTEEVVNAKGHRVSLTETLPGSGTEPVTRKWTTTFDELGRRTEVIAPDTRGVQWAYEGLSTTPTKISIKGSSGSIVVMGKQTLRGAGNQGDEIKTRTVGAEGSPLTFEYDDEGHVRPDKTRLYCGSSEDGNTTYWYAQKHNESTLLVKFEYTPLTRGIKANRLATKDNLQSAITSECLSPQLLGLHRTNRVVRGVTQSRCSQHSLRGSEAGGLHPSGVFSRAWTDSQNRRSRVRRGQLEYRYRYGAQGECEYVAVEDMRTGRKQTIAYRYDEHGREVERTYRLDGIVKSRYVQTWTAIGQLSSKTWYRNGESTPARTENFAYLTWRDELCFWSVNATAGHEIKNAQGDVLISQSYTYTTLGSLLSCVTTFANEDKEEQLYSYGNLKQPTLRTRVTVIRTPKDEPASQSIETQLDYYNSGNQKNTERKQVFAYTHTGQLQSVTSTENGATLATYEYDEFGRLAAQWDEANKQRRVLQYSDNQLCGEVWLDAKGDAIKRRVLDEEAGLVVQMREGQGASETTETLFILADPQNGGGEEFWLNAKGEWESRFVGFTPWGEAPLGELNAMKSGLGYNGQRVDPVTGNYHPGHGYRVYDPQHQAFYQGDSLSPFGKGGLNDRAYCAGRDPVNWWDKDGHIMINRRAQAQSLASLDDMILQSTPPTHEPAEWWEWLLLGVFGALAVIGSIMTGGVLGVVLLAVGATGFALGATSLALKQSNPALSDKLGWASTALSFFDASGAAFAKIAGLIAKGVRAGIQALRSLRHFVKLQGVSALFKASRSGRYLDTARRTGGKVAAGGRTGASVTVYEKMGRDGRNARLAGDLGYIFEDTYKGAPRLNIHAHGGLVGNSGMMALDDGLKLADDVYRKLRGFVNFEKYPNIRLIMCHSADGLNNSFAQRFADLTRSKVKGYVGGVYSNYTANEVGQGFALGEFGGGKVINGLIANMDSLRITKVNPFNPINQSHMFDPVQYDLWLNFRYSPVKFFPRPGASGLHGV